MAVRNDVHRGDSEEFIVLRHYKLAKGMHKAFYEISRTAMWEVYQKIGARVMGDWQVIYPDGEDGGSNDYDESFRLARYASVEHWMDTRSPASMMGSGPFSDIATESAIRRGRLVLESSGAFYLRGHMAPDKPYYMPALKESYKIVEAASDSDGDGSSFFASGNNDKEDNGSSTTSPQPVRYERPVSGHGIVVLELRRIFKGSFATLSSTQNALWPFLSKLGVRMIGEWLVVSPDCARDSLASDLADCDEVLCMARYASYQHWEAVQVPAILGGDGPDYLAAAEALQIRTSLTQQMSRNFLSGYLYDNPAQFAPAIHEHYEAQSRL